MSVRSLALVALGLLFSGCATTPHGQAVQQTAFGAVLVANAVGGTAGVVAGVVATSSSGPLGQTLVPSLVAAGMATAVFYAVGIPLLAVGARTLDEEAARESRLLKVPAATSTTPRNAKAPGKETTRKGTERQTEAFDKCARDFLCFSGDERCLDAKRMEFEDAADKYKWLDRAGCNQMP